MELVLIRLSRTHQNDVAGEPLSPEVAADAMWANATAADLLEHIRARAGPEPGSIDLVLFHRTVGHNATQTALNLCRRAVAAAPALADYQPVLLLDPDGIADIVTECGRRSDDPTVAAVFDHRSSPRGGNPTNKKRRSS